VNNTLVRKTKLKIPVGRLRTILRGYLEYNIKTLLNKLWSKGANRMQMVQDRVPWYAISNTAINHPMVRYCQHSDEPSSSMQGSEFPYPIHNY
jgi:hypothetical protein